MELLPHPYPRLALAEVKELIVPSDAAPDDVLEFILVIDESNLRIRGLTALLQFVDRSYGRLNPKGIRSYALTEREHLEISAVRKGSLEFILETLLQNKDAVLAFLILRSLIKYLPGVLESFSQSYRNYEEARFTREKRRQLRIQINQDEKLMKLERRRQDQLIQFLDYLYERDSRSVRAAGKFAERNLLDVIIRMRRR